MPFDKRIIPFTLDEYNNLSRQLKHYYKNKRPELLPKINIRQQVKSKISEGKDANKNVMSLTSTNCLSNDVNNDKERNDILLVVDASLKRIQQLEEKFMLFVNAFDSLDYRLKILENDLRIEQSKTKETIFFDEMPPQKYTPTEHPNPPKDFFINVHIHSPSEI